MSVEHKNYNPQFCFIAPTSYLDYTAYSKSHLVLAHLVDTDEKYAEFYKNRNEFGDYIVLDNSAYELKEPYSPDKLIELADKCGAKAIVLPDYPFKPCSVTIEAAEQFAPIFKNAGYDTFFVPQSEKGQTEDWIKGYRWGADNELIDIFGMSILGIPNAIPNINPAYARVVMTQMLIDRGIFNFNKHHHYLGLNSGPALEIPSLINMRALDTIDSSGPIHAAILGHTYTKEADSYQMVSKLKHPVDFSIARSKDNSTHDRIKHNIMMTVDLFKPENWDKLAVWYADE